MAKVAKKALTTFGALSWIMSNVRGLKIKKIYNVIKCDIVDSTLRSTRMVTCTLNLDFQYPRTISNDTACEDEMSRLYQHRSAVNSISAEIKRREHAKSVAEWQRRWETSTKGIFLTPSIYS